MEALDFVKLHSLYSHFSSILENTFPLFTSNFYEEEDSFFDLEFNSILSTKNDPCLAQKDVISKRKILPFELSNSKPQSPPSVHKSVPKLSISLFKKPKLTAKEKVEETESKRFAFKLAGINSFRINSQKNTSERKTKRFSRGVRKYLKLIKPFYVRVSKRNGFTDSTESSLRKCKSAMVNRRDDSILQQNDGIEGAILHCKRSFSTSRDAYLLEDDVDVTCEAQKGL